METKKLCCGIDVSHTKLDVCYQNNLGEFFHLQVGNNNQGFAKIMEHTGLLHTSGFLFTQPWLRTKCCKCDSH
jgi:hypothetical protein